MEALLEAPAHVLLLAAVNDETGSKGGYCCTGCERYLETDFKIVIFPDSSKIRIFNFAQVKMGHLATL